MIHLNTFIKRRFGILLIILFFSSFTMAEEKYIIIDKLEGKIKYSVEIADTKDAREKGLMFKKKLPYNKGMLFIFPKSQIVNIWMKNTLMPLDIVYISEEKNIIQIIKNALPKKKKIFASKSFAKYVLELNAGEVNKHNIKIGDKVYLE